MSYSEKLTSYRAEFKKHLKAEDASNARLYAILYAKLVREISAQIDSYMDRAKLSAEAEKYDVFAAMITKYGITDEVKKAILNGETHVAPSAPKKQPKKPSASSVAKKTSPPTVSLTLPDLPAPSVSNTAPSASPSVNVSSAGDDTDWSAEIFEEFLPATLVVRTNAGIGTGFFITSEGHFITNHHVIYEGSKRSPQISIESGDGKIKCEAEFINADKALDVSLLKLKNFRGKTPFIPIIKDYSRVRPGIAMMLIGNGLNFGLAPIAGNVKYTHSKSDGDLVYTAPSNNGDSGAPVFNKDGICIGIHKSSTVGCGIGHTQVRAVGLSNATTAENIRMLLSKWGLEGKV